MSQTLSITNPWTGSTALTLALDDAGAIHAKVTAARAAANAWAGTSLEERIRLVERFISVAGDEKEEVAQALRVTASVGANATKSIRLRKDAKTVAW